MNDDITITVSRFDIEKVCWAASANSRRAPEAVRHVQAAIPEPEWEPTEDQVIAYAQAIFTTADGRLLTYSDSGVRSSLKALHAVGLIS